MKKGILVIFCEILMIIFLPITFTLTNIQIISLNENFYDREINKYDIQKDAKMSYNNLKAAYQNIIDYLGGSKNSLQMKSIVGGKYRNVFDSTELKHMSDVKQLFKEGFILRDAAALLSLFSVAILFLLKKKKSIYKTSVIIFILSVAICLIAGVLLMSDFNKYFDYFHEIFFKNNYWLLDPNTEVLINLCPLNLFEDACVFIFGAYFLEILFITLLLRKVSK